MTWWFEAAHAEADATVFNRGIPCVNRAVSPGCRWVGIPGGFRGSTASDFVPGEMMAVDGAAVPPRRARSDQATVRGLRGLDLQPVPATVRQQDQPADGAKLAAGQRRLASIQGPTEPASEADLKLAHCSSLMPL